uniref:NADH-ubiquinone oxidoreductase chain 2 n=1 Tax=Indochinamon bhumibol TaxID=2771976 RepID=A0A7G1PUR7_9EUCA|nr:NADH dehydrogenase subunit 2 [Indochinamon bhumibol]QNT10753.1 NADH dehydrogenase subunit 2 [Indochinamon bhumibol]BCL51415.1 NADH dehydrogenase subunit 2 [Indochinamon bhumibol]
MGFPPSSFYFFISLLMGIFISISSSSWFGAWTGLELNMMSFIPLITIQMNSYLSESALKYFLIQALGSTFFIMSSCMFLSFTQVSSSLLLVSLLLKLGSAPFHFWFPQVMSGLTWLQVMILMTLQKIAPMFLISYISSTFSNLNKIIYLSTILSAIMGALGGLNMMNLRKMMAFSSINHMSWMLISVVISDSLWVIYFIFYSIISSSIVILFNMFQTFTLSDFMKSSQISMPIHSLLMSLNFLSLGGLPPFTGFIPKWMLTQLLINNNLLVPLIFLLSSALITLYFYIRISIFLFFFTKPSSATNMKLNMPLYFLPGSLLFFNFLMLFLPLIFIFI